MATPTAAELAARLDRLPMTRHIWVLVTLISLGGGFELYDLFLTTYIAPGLLKAGYFTPESLGVFSVPTPYGIAGIELVTIDTYVSALVPRTHRGRAYAFNQFFQFLAVPLVAFLAWLFVPYAPFGSDWWHWVVLIGSAGAILIWFIRLSLPESPRWLARHGRLAEAEVASKASRRGLRHKPAPSFRLRGRHCATRPGSGVLPKSGSRPMIGARSSCRCSISFRPSGITVLPPGSRPC
jgi:putative MFS transporter